MENDRLLESLRTAVELTPNDAALRMHLARMLLLAGRAGEALEHARAACALAPDDEDARDLLQDVESAESTPPEPSPAHPHSNRSEMGPDPALVWDAGSRKPTSLDDVAGLESVKARLAAEFLGPARNPELAERYGKRATGGLLLYGPPGCGKTYIARALAGELGARFLPIDSAMVVSAYPGKSAERLAHIFEEARRNAPSMLFFDEVDAVAVRREHLEDAAWLRSMVNQLLAELDGFSSNAGVFVVGATNAPWGIDSAMRRPGRFDRTVCVLPPDLDARAAIFRSQLRGRLAGNIDIHQLAARTDGFSGADIAHAVEEAASTAFGVAMASVEEVAIDQQMLEEAVSEIRPSVAPWMEQAKNHVLFANRDGALDDLAAYMRERRLL